MSAAEQKPGSEEERYLRQQPGAKPWAPIGAPNEPDEDKGQSGAVQGQEASGATPGRTRGENKEAEAVKGKAGDDLDYGKHGHKSFMDRMRRRKGIRGLFNKKSAIIGVGGGTAIGATFWAFSFMSGPLSLIHFSQLLQGFHFKNNQEFEGGRTARYLWHLKRGAAARSRLSIPGNAYADRIEQRMNDRAGLISLYDRTSGEFLGYGILDEDKARGHVSDFSQDDIPIEGNPPGAARDIHGNAHTNIRFANLNETNRRGKKRLIKSVLRSNRILHIPGGLSARMLIKRAGVDFHPLKNKIRERTQSRLEYWRERKEERSQRRKEGVDPTDGRRLTGETDTDEDGNTTRDTNPAADSGNEFAEQAADADTPSKRNNLLRRLLRGGGIIGAFAQALCIVLDISQGVDQYQFENVILPMMRMGMEIVATGDQLQASGLQGLANGDVNMDEVGSIATDLNKVDPETGKKINYAAAKSIKHELGHENTGNHDIPAEAQPSRVGEKNLLFRIVDSIPFLETACNISDSIISSIPVVSDIVELGEGVITSGINLALSPFGTTIDQLYNSVIGFFAGEAVNTFAQGPDLGNIANYGVRLASRDTFNAVGGVLLSAAEIVALDEDAERAHQIELEKKSFYARTFDLYDAESFASTVVREMPQSPTEAIASVFSSPSKLLSSMFSSVSAQDTQSENYDYGFDESGFTIEEQNDPRFEDPFENADIVEPRLAELNDEWSDCFSIEIVEHGEGVGLIIGGSVNFEDEEYPDNCRTDNNNDHIEDNEDLLRWRFYMADTVQGFSIACAYGDEEACDMLVFGVEEASGAPAGPSGPVDPITGCPTGSTDQGIVVVEGIDMHQCISEQMTRMFSDARAAGLDLVTGTGGWRSPQEQINLRRQNCGTSHYAIYEMPSSQCSPPTARPGSSNHESGAALDISCNGLGMINLSSRPATRVCWDWLVANAGTYGLQNLPSENWHWSVDGN